MVNSMSDDEDDQIDYSEVIISNSEAEDRPNEVSEKRSRNTSMKSALRVPIQLMLLKQYQEVVLHLAIHHLNSSEDR